MKTFKKQFIVLILFLLFIAPLVTSCSQSDDSVPEENLTGSIFGRWALDKRNFISNGVTTPVLDYENNQPGCALNDFFEFKADGSFDTGYYDPSCTVALSTGIWVKDGEMINVSYPADPSEPSYVLELLNVTATEMKIKIDLTGTDGVEPGVELFILYTMVKVN